MPTTRLRPPPSPLQLTRLAQSIVGGHVEHLLELGLGLECGRVCARQRDTMAITCIHVTRRTARLQRKQTHIAPARHQLCAKRPQTAAYALRRQTARIARHTT
jgi:hypothetical protein